MLQEKCSTSIQSIAMSLTQSMPFTVMYQQQSSLSIDSQFLCQSQQAFSQAQIQHVSQGSQYHIKNFIPRSHNDIRSSYLSKLLMKGYIPKQSKRKYRHLFVYDWDDTFLCTTYLNHLQFVQLKEKEFNLMCKIDQAVYKILHSSLAFGDVSIITNAAKGWVQYSGKKYLPKTLKFIEEFKIPIISARSQHAEQFPTEIKKWKVSAFQKLNSTETNHLITNIICVGDSTNQMQAGQILASSFEKSLLKTVKLRENPRIQQLLKQQQLLILKLDQIVNSVKNLTIRLQRRTPN